MASSSASAGAVPLPLRLLHAECRTYAEFQLALRELRLVLHGLLRAESHGSAAYRHINVRNGGFRNRLGRHPSGLAILRVVGYRLEVTGAVLSFQGDTASPTIARTLAAVEEVLGTATDPNVLFAPRREAAAAAAAAAVDGRSEEAKIRRARPSDRILGSEQTEEAKVNDSLRRLEELHSDVVDLAGLRDALQLTAGVAGSVDKSMHSALLCTAMSSCGAISHPVQIGASSAVLKAERHKAALEAHANRRWRHPR